ARFTEEVDKASVVHASVLAREGVPVDGEPVPGDATILSLARRLVEDTSDTVPVSLPDGRTGAMDRRAALAVLFGEKE
ncbi:MAG: ABC transporter ATP-binding protein, partial [Boseongicola sp.]|nr:ABC transporter ATP-binding protein [Boseongicola sp.]